MGRVHRIGYPSLAEVGRGRSSSSLYSWEVLKRTRQHLSWKLHSILYHLLITVGKLIYLTEHQHSHLKKNMEIIMVLIFLDS